MTRPLKPGVQGNAVFSPCGRYRYLLRRKWETLLGSGYEVLFLMLNPSTAEADVAGYGHVFNRDGSEMDLSGIALHALDVSAIEKAYQQASGGGNNPGMVYIPECHHCGGIHVLTKNYNNLCAAAEEDFRNAE